jgi:hypothetical protein
VDATDDAHLATNVDELRHLVDAEPSGDPADRRDALIITTLHTGLSCRPRFYTR